MASPVYYINLHFTCLLLFIPVLLLSQHTCITHCGLIRCTTTNCNVYTRTRSASLARIIEDSHKQSNARLFDIPLILSSLIQDPSVWSVTSLSYYSMCLATTKCTDMLLSKRTWNQCHQEKYLYWQSIAHQQYLPCKEQPYPDINQLWNDKQLTFTNSVQNSTWPNSVKIRSQTWTNGSSSADIITTWKQIRSEKQSTRVQNGGLQWIGNPSTAKANYSLTNTPVIRTPRESTRTKSSMLKIRSIARECRQLKADHILKQRTSTDIHSISKSTTTLPTFSAADDSLPTGGISTSPGISRNQHQQPSQK